MESNYWTASRGRWQRRSVLQAGVAATGAGLAGFLAGCGDDDDTPSAPAAGSTAAGGSPAAQATVDYSKMTEKEFFAAIPNMPAKDFDDKDIKVGGTARRLIPATGTFDFQAAGPSGTPGEMVGSVYSKLIRFSAAAGVMKDTADTVIEADLAQKWEQPDTQTVILTLNPGVKWQNVAPLNGRPFTVEDIKYSFDRGATSTKSAYKQFYTQFTKIEDVGNNQVKFTLGGPNPAALILLGSPFACIMSRELGEKPEIAATQAVGTGSMIMDKFTPNVEIVYKKNPDFFKKDAQGRQKPYMDGYTSSVVSDPAAAANQIEGGAFDIFHSSSSPAIPDQVFSLAKRQPDIVIQTFTLLYVPWAFTGHYQQAPWKDVRVRQAFSNLIDRKTINDTLMKGLALDGPYFPFNALFDKKPTLDALGPNYKYDPARAKQLLSAAGVSNLSFNVAYWSFNTFIENYMLLVQETLAQGGIKLNLMKTADSAALGAAQVGKKWDGLVQSVRGLDFPDPMSSFPAVLPGTGSNFGDIDNPKYQELYEKQRKLLGADRKAALKEAWDYYLEDVPEVTTPQRANFIMWRQRIKNFRDAGWGLAASGLGMGQWDSMWKA